jgi:hypothetical protein
MGFRAKVRLGIGIIKMSVLAPAEARMEPSEVIRTAKQMKQSRRVTTVQSYDELVSELNTRGKQFMPDGWADLKYKLESIEKLFAFHPGCLVHLIVHNADPSRLKRIELETPVGNILTAWTDS